jgi:flagellar motor switch protein FliM
VLALDANTEGTISIVTPFISLKPIRDLLRSRIQTSEDNDAKANQWREELRDACGHSKLELVVNLAKISSTLKELQRMNVGDILYFAKPEYASVEISDAKVFTAEVGSIGNNVAVQIKKFVQTPTSNQ